MVSWMFHKGLVICKKMLITGMIMSSAPVVIPPLVMMTALGFAVSVPCGIILASYTFSEKLLNKLLPGTSPPFSLEEEGYSAACKEVEEDYRLIGGYKAARQATCMEELRALYLFTGVEPPVSFKDASDLAEVNKKLQFLLSVVGVM